MDSFLLESEQEFVNLDDRVSKLAKFAPHLWRDDVCIGIEVTSSINVLLYNTKFFLSLKEYCFSDFRFFAFQFC